MTGLAEAQRVNVGSRGKHYSEQNLCLAFGSHELRTLRTLHPGFVGGTAAFNASWEVGCRNPLLNESNLGCHRMAWDASIIGLGLKEEGPFSNTAWINTGLWVQNNQSHNSEMH